MCAAGGQLGHKTGAGVAELLPLPTGKERIGQGQWARHRSTFVHRTSRGNNWTGCKGGGGLPKLKP